MTTPAQDLISIRAQIDAVIAKLGSEEPGDPGPIDPEWEIPLATLAGEPGYLNEPRLLECANGDLLCIYRKGTAHVSNGGTLEQRRSTDRGLTWGDPSTLQAVAGRDCRNHAVGITPTGRLLVFNRTSNVAVTDKHWRHYSDDNGLTWATDEFFPIASCAAFGRVVQTTVGLMRMCYLGNKIACEFSTDDGLTWGSVTYPWNASQQNATVTEPFAIALDSSRIVVVMRDDQDGGRYFWSKSADGGATWSYPAGARWTTGVPVPAAPMSFALHGGKVHAAWDGRTGFWKGYSTETDIEAFWSNPGHAWQSGVAALSIDHSSVIGAGSSATAGEYGYTDLLSISEGVLSAWYDSKTGIGTSECRIVVKSI